MPVPRNGAFATLTAAAPKWSERDRERRPITKGGGSTYCHGLTTPPPGQGPSRTWNLRPLLDAAGVSELSIQPTPAQPRSMQSNAQLWRAAFCGSTPASAPDYWPATARTNGTAPKGKRHQTNRSETLDTRSALSHNAKRPRRISRRICRWRPGRSESRRHIPLLLTDGVYHEARWHTE